MQKTSRTLAWVLVAVAGGSCGFFATAKRAKACDCTIPTWTAHLKSVISSDPKVDDSRIWPQRGTLFSESAANGHSSLSFDSVPGMIERVVTP